MDEIQFNFEPAEYTATVGETVTWEWEGFHNVIADDDTFNSGDAVTGGEFEFTFEEEGTWQYYCSIHGQPGGIGMSATVIVEAA